jgi:glycosyltransferase involved in cell wall biosynthesis
MKSMPLVSVVIPTYRRPSLLARCLNALCDQTFPSELYEIIVVSDGPDDATNELLETFIRLESPQIRYHALPARRGPAAARNMGWQNANAELVAFTDDDCIPEEAWLQRLYTAYRSSGLQRVALKGRTIVPLPGTPTDYEKNISNLERAEFITANCACSKQVLLATGGFDEQFARAWREDSDLQFTLLHNNIPILAVDAVVTHPVRVAPWGISLKEEKKNMYDVLLYKKHPHLYRERIQPQPEWPYYLMILSLLIFLGGMMSSSFWMGSVGLLMWIILWARFTWKRLAHTSRSIGHISEMAITSSLIPFLSLYWRWYGVWKYKKPLF